MKQVYRMARGKSEYFSLCNDKESKDSHKWHIDIITVRPDEKHDVDQIIVIANPRIDDKELMEILDDFRDSFGYGHEVDALIVKGKPENIQLKKLKTT